MQLKKEEYIAVAIALVVITIFFISNPLSTLFGSPSGNQQANVSDVATTTTATSTSSVGNIQTVDMKVGSGVAVKTGQTVKVLYVGSFPNAKVFDSSAQHGNQPIEFTVGAGQVIKGLDLGMVGMRVGGVRRMTIPPELGYGSQGNPVIPANSTLIFEITLVGIK